MHVARTTTRTTTPNPTTDEVPHLLTNDEEVDHLLAPGVGHGGQDPGGDGVDQLVDATVALAGRLPFPGDAERGRQTSAS